MLIRGRNLDQLLKGSINMTRGSLQRHRLLWLREMTEDEIRQVGDTGPTTDGIQLKEFDSQVDLKEWLSKTAPAFLW